MKKTYLAKETTDGVQSLQVMLVQWLESTVSQFWSSSHPELKATIIQMPAFKAQVLKGYSSVITTKKSITESDHALMHNMCNLCIELLQANANVSFLWVNVFASRMQNSASAALRCILRLHKSIEVWDKWSY